jgi:hypothetical protein
VPWAVVVRVDGGAARALRSVGEAVSASWRLGKGVRGLGEGEEGALAVVDVL